jgi:hypothetical protein
LKLCAVSTSGIKEKSEDFHMNDIDRLAQRVAALEKRVGSEELIDKKDRNENQTASTRDVLASEIEALEKRLLAEDEEEKEEAPDVKVEEVEAKKSSDEKDLPQDEDKTEKKASIVDPSGIEESITQDYLTEVEDLAHGEELTTGDSVLDVAPTGYTARLKNASARLDKVASYLEKTGRTEMALRIDKIADAVDARIAKFTK